MLHMLAYNQRLSCEDLTVWMPKITSADHCETNDDYMQRRYVNETTDECMERRYVNETTDDCM